MPVDLQKVREVFLHAVGKLPPEECVRRCLAYLGAAGQPPEEASPGRGA